VSSKKAAPYAVIPVIMLFSIGHTIEVFKFAPKHFSSVSNSIQTLRRFVMVSETACHVFSPYD